MINQELIDFIKLQLSKSVDKETITKELLGSGWNEEDIQKGFGLANAKIINLTSNSSAPIPPTINVEAYNKGKKFTIAASIITVVIATNLIFGDELTLLKDELVKSIKGSKTEIINQVKQMEDIKTEIKTETPVTTETTQEQNSETKIEEKTPVVAPVVENKVVAKNDLIDCGNEDCFQQKFVLCQPSTLKTDAGFAAADYRIIGPATGGCNMTFKYSTNPNPKWVNKEMTCIFDNKIDFEESVQSAFMGVFNDTIVCSGPLYTILKSM